jgi:DNA-binding response OmpR family regulator
MDTSSSIITIVNAHAAPAVVLVADDEPTMLELVTRHLRSIAQPKLEVIEASDGDEAWKLAQERLPDLVVLDVMMPGMSGWEVCRKIRQDASLAHTGVLMLTGIGESLNETTSPLFGADEHIDKPFDFEKLDELIERVLAKRAAQREAVPRPTAATRSATPSHVGNGVGGPAKAAATARSKSKRPAKKAKPAVATQRSKKRSAKADRKGHGTMAAKKGAKKGAKKSKKGAKKAKKK